VRALVVVVLVLVGCGEPVTVKDRELHAYYRGYEAGKAKAIEDCVLGNVRDTKGLDLKMERVYLEQELAAMGAE